MPSSHLLSRYRLVLCLNLIAVVPIGYLIRFAPAPVPSWMSDSLGSVFYEVFWILFVLWLFPKWATHWVAIGVCLTTFGLEVLQLWQPDWLQAIRATLPGRLVLGNTFTWTDFPAYVVGSGLGWVWAEGLRRRWGI